MVQTDNANLIHEKDNLEDLNSQMANKFQELQTQLDSEVVAKQETKSQLDSSKTKLKSLQQNYESLVSNQGDSQPLIQVCIIYSWFVCLYSVCLHSVCLHSVCLHSVCLHLFVYIQFCLLFRNVIKPKPNVIC